MSASTEIFAGTLWALTYAVVPEGTSWLQIDTGVSTPMSANWDTNTSVRMAVGTCRGRTSVHVLRGSSYRVSGSVRTRMSALQGRTIASQPLEPGVSTHKGHTSAPALTGSELTRQD